MNKCPHCGVEIEQLKLQDHFVEQGMTKPGDSEVRQCKECGKYYAVILEEIIHVFDFSTVKYGTLDRVSTSIDHYNFWNCLDCGDGEIENDEEE